MKYSIIFLVFSFVLFTAHAQNFSVRYIVLGDWGSVADGGAYAKTQVAVAEAMGEVAKNYSTHFVVTVGDNFYETGVSSPDDPQFETDFVGVYTQSGLQTPWMISLGNHDYQGIVQAQLDYHKDPRWTLPSRNYTVTIPVGTIGSTFVFIDTTPFISDYYAHPENPQMKIELASQHWNEQVAWLNETLFTVRQKYGENHWITVYGHHPVYVSSVANGKRTAEDIAHELQTNDMLERADPLFRKYHVNAYICGHAHNLQHLQANGIDYFISGAGSRVDLPPIFRKKHAKSQPQQKRNEEQNPIKKYAATIPGFMLVQMNEEIMQSTFFDNNAKEVYSAVTKLK